MPYIFIKSRYPSHKIDELLKKNLEVVPKYPPNPSLGETVVSATKADGQGIVSLSIYEVKKGKFEYVSEAYEDYKDSKKKGAIIHWLPANSKLKVEVIHPDQDKTTDKGWGEDSMKSLKEGEIVQLERRYFARLDKKGKDKLVFWFLHR